MRKFIANLPIKYKLVAAMLAVVITAEVITALSFNAANDTFVKEYVKASSSQIAKMIADRNTSMVDFINPDEIQKSLENIKSLDELENVHIYDLKGNKTYIQPQSGILNLTDFAPGVYILQMNNRRQRLILYR